MQIGLSDFHYAINVDDKKTGVLYTAPKGIEKLNKADVTPTSNTATYYGDDGPAETAVGLGEITVSLEVADIPLEDQAAMLGHSMVGGVLIKKGSDVPPYIAIMFRSLKSDGTYRYKKLLKGRFQLPKDSYSTKKDTPELTGKTIEGKFVIRDYDGEWERTADESNPANATEIANWFTSVEGTADTTPPTMTFTAPATAADNAVFTFNEEIADVTAANVFVLDSTNAVVAGAVTLDSTRKIVTFNPTTNLATGSYQAIVTGVSDLAGNVMAQAVHTFTI